MSDRVPPSSHRLRRMASDYEDAVSETRSEHIAARAVARVRAGAPAHRRLVAVLAGASLVALMFVAVGATTSSSLPGDPFYGVSRAYEAIGARVGFVNPVERRLNEVIALADRGDAVLAAQVAEEALAELERSTGLQFQPSLLPTTTIPDESSADATRSTAPPAQSVEASPADTPEQRIASLRLAAQFLLSHVKDNGGDLEAAAAGLAKAVSDIGKEEPPPLAEPTTTTLAETDTSTTIGDTSTTVADETTTTTISDTTSTSVGAGGGKGPIFFPPAP